MSQDTLTLDERDIEWNGENGLPCRLLCAMGDLKPVRISELGLVTCLRSDPDRRQRVLTALFNDDEHTIIDVLRAADETVVDRVLRHLPEHTVDLAAANRAATELHRRLSALSRIIRRTLASGQLEKLQDATPYLDNGG